ncbi:conserved protein, unknown function [Hepatocystis sp. ex Piliocolobus tephrosceles]|nr:conserved protein, unknown function [Hepatocystis sp. ex Piliocolobus tephrosceles]
MEKQKKSKSNENYKDMVDCYYLLLRKYKKKSTYVIDEFLIKENKESTGTLTIYEDVNSDPFFFLILSIIDSKYDKINKINILNVQNANDLLKAICFYMDNIEIDELLKKNTKNAKKQIINKTINNKSSLTNKQKESEKKNDNKILSKIKKSSCNIKSLSIFNSNIDTTGIIFLSKSLYDNGYAKLENLSIDCINLITDDIKYLSLSLCNYNALKTLSLQYCNINNDSIRYIIDIIIYVNSSLLTLNLCGNHFNAQGISRLFESFLLNKSLKSIDVSYNMFHSDESFVEAFKKLVANSTNISTLSLVGNFLDNNCLSKINEAMSSNKSISILRLPLDCIFIFSYLLLTIITLIKFLQS